MKLDLQNLSPISFLGCSHYLCFRNTLYGHHVSAFWLVRPYAMHFIEKNSEGWARRIIYVGALVCILLAGNVFFSYYLGARLINVGLDTTEAGLIFVGLTCTPLSNKHLRLTLDTRFSISVMLFRAILNSALPFLPSRWTRCGARDYTLHLVATSAFFCQQ